MHRTFTADALISALTNPKLGLCIQQSPYLEKRAEKDKYDDEKKHLNQAGSALCFYFQEPSSLSLFFFFQRLKREAGNILCL